MNKSGKIKSTLNSSLEFSADSDKALYLSNSLSTWINAKILCNNFGMQLLTPDSEADDEAIRNALTNLGAGPDSIFIGATSLGASEDRWYSVESGKILSFDFEWKNADELNEFGQRRDFENNEKENNCLMLVQPKIDFSYDTTNCFYPKSRFVCQKIVLHASDRSKIEWIDDCRVKIFIYTFCR